MFVECTLLVHQNNFVGIQDRRPRVSVAADAANDGGMTLPNIKLLVNYNIGQFVGNRGIET